MSVDGVLDEALRDGIYLYVDDNKLKYLAARNALSAELKKKLAIYKEAIIDRLARDAASSGAGASSLGSISAVDRESAGPLCLSFGQRRLWFFHRYTGANAVYNMPLALRLHGEVNEAALVRTVEELHRRHESLRTRFVAGDDSAVQVIDPPGLDLAVEVVSALDAKAIARSERFHRFDLSSEPLCRIRLLLERESCDYVLLVTMHHSVSDAWSLGILFHELVSLYRSYANGESSPLAPLPIQYADYAHWQRHWLQGAVLEEQLSYWREQLKGLPPLLTLPTDRPRPAEQTFRGSTERFELPAALAEQLQALSREQGVTLFMTLLSAFAVLLGRYSGQQDVAVGTPIANRTRQETEGLIGFFVNTLVMRHDLSGDPRFIDLLGSTRATALQAYAHQDVPFEQLVEELNPQRSVNHSPLFQVMFALQNAPFEALELPGLAMQPLDTADEDGEGAARFDLTLSMHESPLGLVGMLEYNTDLFERDTVRRMFAHYARLLEAIAAAPQSRLSQLKVLGEEERHRQLIEWNASSSSCPRDKTVQALFEEQAERSPEAIAVVAEDRQLTYREVNDRANALAHCLIERGIEPQTLVGLCVDGRVERMIGLLGILKAGGACVPLDPDDPAERLEYLFEDSAVELVVTQSSVRSRVELRGHDVERRWVELQADGRVPGYRHTNPEALVSASDLAFVIYEANRAAPVGRMVPHSGVLEESSLRGQAPSEGWIAKLLTRLTSSRLETNAEIRGAAHYILDRDGELLPLGAVGELCVGGEGVSWGYRHRPGLTAERFVPNAFSTTPGARLYRTGARARWTANGALELIEGESGRDQEQHPDLFEIERALSAHEGVREATVVALETGAQLRLVAYVVERVPGAMPAELFVAQLKEYLRTQPASSRLPDDWMVMELLPRTPNGKVDRKALPTPNESADAAYTSPEGVTEELLAQLWCALLKCERVGRHDNFFELGGHSLLATQLSSRIREAFSTELPVRELFESATLSSQARAIERARGADTLVDAPIEAVSRDQPLPLSYAQQRLWFLHQYMGPNAVYNMPLALRLRGDMDESALVRCLKELYRRHKSLRTRFVSHEGSAIQVIDPPELALSVEVVSTEDAKSIAHAERFYCFDLSNERLCRIRLLRESGTAGDYVLLVTMHHSVSDGWSLGIFFREFVSLYRAYANGEDSPLAPLPIQYADYAQWQRRWLRESVIEEQLSYWREQLKGLPPLLTLPTDRPRPSEQTFRGSLEPFSVPASLAEKLQTLSREQGVTLYMTLLSAFAVLLGRYAGQQDVAIGTPISNRTRRETEGLIGFFVNTLIMRQDLSGDPSFVELLKRTRAMALQAYAYQDIPFEQLVEELNPRRSLAYSPLFQVSFSLVNTPAMDQLAAGDVSIVAEEDVSERGEGIARYDISFNVSLSALGIAGAMEFNTDVFSRPTIVAMLDHYERLLEAIVAAPQKQISRYELLSEQEKHQQLHAWNATTLAYPADRCVHELFEEQAARQPDAIAVVSESRQLSYGELNRRANQLAHCLRERGVGAEVRVGICMGRSPEIAVGLLGILKAGGAYVPLDPEYPKVRLEYMLTQSGCRVVLSEQKFLMDLPSSSTMQVLPLDIELHEELFGAYNDANVAVEDSGVCPTNLAYVIYTSGSTGQPKGSAIVHQNISRLIHSDFVDYANARTILCAASPSFDAFTFELWGALLHGGRSVMSDSVRTGFSELGSTIDQQGVDCAWLTSSLFNRLIDDSADSLRSLKRLLVGGEALSIEHIREALRQLPQTQLINGYGPTENTTFSCTYSIEREALSDRSSVPIGRPIGNTQAYVLGPHGEIVPRGVVGELHLGGAGLARGYLGQAGLTAQKFVPNAFAQTPGERLYRTGDLVRHLPDGNIEFIGRVDHQVKVRGFRIELGEIESALHRHESVREAIVLAREDQPGVRTLVAYVVATQEAREAGELQLSLLEHLRGLLPDYMVPAALVLLDALPLTVNKKVDVQALPTPDDSAYARAAYQAPETAMEKALAELWQQNLGLETVGTGDNYFSLGGDSIRSIALVTEAKRRGLKFSVRDLFSHSTIKALAQVTESGEPVVPEAEIEPFSLLTEAEKTYLGERYDSAKIEDAFPLSTLQQGLIYHSLAHKELSTYHDILTYRIRERWDPALFDKALSHVVSRHGMLRTVFDLGGTRSIQVVFKHADPIIEIVDIADASATARIVEQWIEQERRQGIELSSLPWKMRVHVLADGEFIVGMSFHHALYDGWSDASFFNELLTTYSLYQQQGHVNESAPPPSYKHFVALEQKATASPENAAYWRNKLQGARLPWWTGDLREPSATIFHEVPEDSSSKVLALAATLGVQEKSVWSAVYLALISLLDGANDVVGSVVTHGRPELPGSEKTLGLFLNSLPMRVDMTGMRWSDLILAAEAELQALHEVRHFPLAEVQAQLGMSFSASFFNFVSFHVYEKNMTEGQLSSYGGVAETNYPLTFQVQRFQDLQRCGIHVSLDPAVFNAHFRERIRGYVAAIVECLLAHSSERIDKAALLGSAELTKLLTTWNATAHAYPREKCIHELFEAHANRTPDRIALVHEDREFTYGELNRRANNLARRLIERGVGPEERVGLCMPRSPELVIGILGILKAGGCYVPLDPDYPRKRLDYLLDDAQIDIVVTEASVASRVSGPGRDLLLLTEAETSENVNSKQFGLRPDHPAYLIYTSASTGAPKGVLGLHRSIVNRVNWLARSLGVGADEVLCQKTSVGFVDHVAEIFQALSAGVPLVIVAPSLLQAPQALLRELDARGVTQLTLVPSLLKTLLEAGHGEQARSLKSIYTSGEALHLSGLEKLAECFPHARLFNIYGSTEMGADVTCQEVTVDRPGAWAPIGKAIDNTQAYILDADGQLAVSGAIGELHVGGVCLSRGYFQRASLTAERFIPHPFSQVPGARVYRTGDLARWLPDGTLEYLGRADHQVKVRGFRIELGEIESVLLAHESVREAVVLARDDAGDKRLVAYVVPKSGEVALIDDWRSRLQEQLPAYMVPSAFVVLDSLPRTSTGKLDRKALPAPEDTADGEYTPPEGVTEELLAELWCVLLKRERVGRNDNFFELGGHSLLATQLISRIRDAFSTDLPVRKLFEHPTLSSQARAIESARGVGASTNVAMEVVSRTQPLALSYAQQRLWFLHQYMGPSAVYNMPLGLRLHGDVNEAALVQSLEELYRRHESLRTRFSARDERIVQLIDPPELELEVTVVSAAEAKAIAYWERSYHFDLSRERLCRIRLLRETDPSHDYVLLLTMHHSVSDGWSLGIFFRELVSLYRAYANAEDSPLAPLPIQYADYAQWQRHWLQGAVLEEQVSYWREQLSGLPPLLTLPTDRPRPNQQTFRGSIERLEVPPSLAGKLQALSREQGVTLYMTLLSAFAFLLSRYASQQDVAVGTPIANRTRRETEGLIGYFVNTLVTRHDLSGDPRFVDLLKRTRAMALQAYAHQDVPFEQLVEELNPQRSVSHSPLFQVMFILQNAPFEAIELPGLEVLPLDAAAEDAEGAREGTARFDLTLSMSESPSGLAGVLEYNTDLFERGTIRRMLDHYARLLESIVDAPQARLSRLEMLGGEERYQQIVEWNATARSYPDDQCIHELFEERAEQTPDRIALVHEGFELTYGELNRRANGLAHRLIERGVGPEVRVGLCMPRSAQMMIGILGILKAGGCYVPLDPDYPRKRLESLLEDARIELVVTEPSVASRVTGRDLISLTEPSANETLENVDSRGLRPDHPVYLIYTSASTGAPKGVVGLHRSIVNRVNWLARSLGVGAREVLCQKTSVGFVDHVAEIFQALSAGVPLVIVSPSLLQSPQELLRELDARGVTQLTLVPSLLKTLLEAGQGERARWLRSIYSSGEALHLSGLERFAECFPYARLFNIYGSTEMGADVTYAEVETENLSAEAAGLWAPIGKGIDNTQAYILDADGQMTVAGAIGELHVGGACLSRGYFKRGGLTAERFIPHPFSEVPGARVYRTGDLARWLPDGTLEYLGRADHQVKVRGFRIELGEVESVLLAHEAVRDAVVVVSESSGDKRLVSYVVAKPGAQADDVALIQELRDRLREQLPAHMVPSAFVVLENLPRTATGKVDRKSLPAPDASMFESEHVPPEGLTEELLADVWRLLLKNERVGRHANFFELGGHSLLAMQLVSRIREAFAIELPVRHVFEHATLSSQARVIEHARGRGLLADTTIETVSRDQPLPLSYAQQRLWFLHQYMGPNAVYNMPLALRLHGNVNEAALVQSLEELYRRHETLHTRFETEGDGVVQVIDPPQLAIAVESVSTLQTQAIALAERFYCFDLSSDPLCRIRLLREADDYVLLVTMHHSVSDGWSLGIFFRELMSLYRAYANGADPPLAPLPIQYADYAQWQRNWLQGDVLEEQVSYWREQLAGLPPLLTLPTDRPRPAEQTFRGSSEGFAVPASLLEKLHALSREQGVTLYMTLLSAFAVLLGRYAGQQDVAVGTPVANRMRRETEGLIGFFANTLVTRHDLSSDPRFSDLLKRTRTMALQAYAHQDIPFEQLVEALNPQRSVSHSPLFQVMFILQNAPFDALELPGLEVQPLNVAAAEQDGEAAQEGTARFDLTLSMAESPLGLVGGFEYNTDLFERGTIRRMLDHYTRLLESIAAAPQSRLSRLEMLGSAERHQQLVAWNATARAYPQEKCVHALFEAQAEQTPDRIALVYEDCQLTYGELNRRANRLAHQLIERGVGPEVRVGLCMQRSAEMMIGLLGILKSGGCYVPLDPNHPQQRLAYALEDSGLALVVGDAAQWMFLEPAQRPTCVSLEDAGTDEALPKVHLPASALAYVIYTSGSTGKPKGTRIGHGNVVNFLLGMQETLGIGSQDRLLAVTTLSFDIALLELYLPLTIGAMVDIAPAESVADGERLMKRLEQNRITLLQATPVTWKLLLDSGWQGSERLTALVGGEAFSRELATRLFGKVGRIWNMYGPTETTIWSTCWRVAQSVETSTVPIGHPIANTDVYVLDDYLQLAPAGTVGQLYLAGAGVSQGYLNRPGLTAERFLPHPFSQKLGERLYGTGDLARWLPDGTLECLGRVDHQVKVRGFRIELGEIESALLAHESVRDAVVVVHEGDAGNKRLVGYVVAETDADTESLVGALRSRLQEQLPSYMVPATLMVLPSLPLTANGKVDRKALLAPGLSSEQRTFVPPTTQIERWLCEIWQSVLRIERIGIEDNFFAVGGDSISSIQVVSRAKTVGLKLTVRELFKHPTISQLAKHIDLQRAQEPPQLLAQQASAGEMPLLPIHRRLFESGAPRPQHYHQSQLLSVPAGFSLEFLRSFVVALYHRHDALRLRYRREGEQWQGYFAPVDEELISKTVMNETLRGESAASREAQRLRSAQMVKAGFDLQQGPLFKAVYYDAGCVEDSSLLLVLHHLAVDGVSWRILLHDLSLAFEQWRAGTAIALAEKTSSYQQWAGMLLEHAGSAAVQEERDFWIAQFEPAVAPLPLNPEADSSATEEVGRLVIALEPEETEALLTRCGQVYRAQIQELLLAGLLLTFHDWTGQRRVRVNVEGHGREEDAFADVDLSETVGWFTSLYPVCLELPEGAADEETLLVETIKTVKQQLRSVPEHGLNYGVLRYLARDERLEELERVHGAQVLFNYLGQFDQPLDQGTKFASLRGDTGADVDPAYPREHLLEFNGAVSGDCLRFEMDYHPRRIGRETAEQLCSRYAQVLRRIIQHGQAPRMAAFTPSDFPLAFRALERI